MFLYRAVPKRFVENYSGRGQSFETGGRWNQQGNPVLYFALSPSLSRLEAANYHASPRLIPRSYVLAEYEVDAAVERAGALGDGWDVYPYPKETQEMGTEWLLSKRSLIMVVPSVTDSLLVDHCAVVNPLHPDISKIRHIRHVEGLFSVRAFPGA